MPRSLSFVISLEGIMVLNAELKSMNNSLAYVLLLSRWERAECRSVEMASSVLLF